MTGAGVHHVHVSTHVVVSFAPCRLQACAVALFCPYHQARICVISIRWGISPVDITCFIRQRFGRREGSV